jgi:hypothetical protein
MAPSHGFAAASHREAAIRGAPASGLDESRSAHSLKVRRLPPFASHFIRWCKEAG